MAEGGEAFLVEVTETEAVAAAAASAESAEEPGNLFARLAATRTSSPPRDDGEAKGSKEKDDLPEQGKEEEKPAPPLKPESPQAKEMAQAESVDEEAAADPPIPGKDPPEEPPKEGDEKQSHDSTVPTPPSLSPEDPVASLDNSEAAPEPNKGKEDEEAKAESQIEPVTSGEPEATEGGADAEMEEEPMEIDGETEPMPELSQEPPTLAAPPSQKPDHEPTRPSSARSRSLDPVPEASSSGWKQESRRSLAAEAPSKYASVEEEKRRAEPSIPSLTHRRMWD